MLAVHRTTRRRRAGPKTPVPAGLAARPVTSRRRWGTWQAARTPPCWPSGRSVGRERQRSEMCVGGPDESGSGKRLVV